MSGEYVSLISIGLVDFQCPCGSYLNVLTDPLFVFFPCFSQNRNNPTTRASTVAIAHQTTVYIGHSNFIGNANSNGVGGAVDNSGTLIVHQSTFEGNEAAQAGGAIMSRANATLGLSSCVFTANNATTGPAVYVEGSYDAVTVNSNNKGKAHQGCNGIYFQLSGCLDWTATKSSTPMPTLRSKATDATSHCDEPDAQREIGIMSVLVNVSGSTPFQDPSSAQFRAAEWIMRDDERSLCSHDPTLVQRYIMAVFYFGLGGDNWKSCGRLSKNCTDSQGQPLVRHLSKERECEWAGIRCSTGSSDHCITEIHRDSNDLGGRLSDIGSELATLSCIEVIDLDDNLIVGHLPSSLSKLPKLRVLDIDHNRLHGTIHRSLFELPLQVLDINDNYFSGSISSDIGKLSESLEIVQLHGNAFHGSIPSELGLCHHLETITLHDNAFTGAVPQKICSLREQGSLINLWADCAPPVGGVACVSLCCTKCLYK